MVKISTGNIKIQNTFIWSIAPIDTCPGATDLCKKYCYAMKAYRQYPSTKTAWDINTALARTGEFKQQVTDYLNKELASKRKTAQFKHFRIHESGDFFNQEYLNQWMQVAEQFPEIEFLAYTKSSWLDFSARPANMVIYFSQWSDTLPVRLEQAHKQGLPIARLEDSEKTNTLKDFDCKPNSKCADCRVCWLGKTDIIFHLH
jgi:hypothetical protein